jgi:hypothetical protein
MRLMILLCLAVSYPMCVFHTSLGLTDRLENDRYWKIHPLEAIIMILTNGLASVFYCILVLWALLTKSGWTVVEISVAGLAAAPFTTYFATIVACEFILIVTRNNQK